MILNSGDEDEDITGLTLQEAFMKRRRDFLVRSQQRKTEAKVKAKQKHIQIKGNEVKSRHKAKQHVQLTNTLASWKRNRGLNVPTNRGK